MKKKISLLTPVFNEEENLPKYLEVVKNKLLTIEKYSFEIIFIEDGSKDLSWEIIKTIVQIEKNFKAIRLSRNMGSHIALSAGFMIATGDAVCVLACDLQDPPETILEFIEKWEEGFDLIFGKRVSRKDSFFRKFVSYSFDFVLRKWAMPRGSQFTTGSFLLADRKVVNYFNKFQEHNRITFAIMAFMGFKQTQVNYNRHAREKGKSGWSLLKMISTLYDALIAFSYAPVRFISIISILSLIGTIPFSFYVLYLFFANRTGNMGWISTILTVSFFGSLNMSMLGLVLEYLTRVHTNTTNRPVFFISENIGIAIEES